MLSWQKENDKSLIWPTFLTCAQILREHNFTQTAQNGLHKADSTGKVHALTLIEQVMSVIHVATALKVPRQDIYHLKHIAMSLPPRVI